MSDLEQGNVINYCMVILLDWKYNFFSKDRQIVTYKIVTMSFFRHLALIAWHLPNNLETKTNLVSDGQSTAPVQQGWKDYNFPRIVISH